MLFNSYIFVLFFLPIALLGYYGLNYYKKVNVSKIFLIGMSLWFYAYFQFSYVFIILTSVILNFLCSKGIQMYGQKKGIPKLLLGIGIVGNITNIFYFKYFNFFLNNINIVFKTDYLLRDILMPLGISFFTFQQISYLVDTYRGETKDYTFLDYTLFVTFFPQLVAGPIVLHDELIPQFNDSERKRLNQDKLAQGIWIFTIGLFKKVMIADVLGKAVDFGFSNVYALSPVDTVIVTLCYTLQLYFDFSGYCDMAMGIANMFGIDLPLNFNSPYKAYSITEYWHRWHITLSRFLRKYIYYPLGGSKKGKWRKGINLLIVFLVSGIWHGANWTFILWGVFHGIARVFEDIGDTFIKRIPKGIRWLCTFVFVNFTMIMFRAGSVKEALVMYSNFIGDWTVGIQVNGLAECFNILELTYVEEHISVLKNLLIKVPWLNMIIILVCCLLIALLAPNCHEKKFKPNFAKAIACIVLLIWSIVSFSGLSTFLYFNF